MLASVGAPAVPDYVNIHIWILFQQFFEKFSDYKAIFPIIKGVMPFSCMDIASHEQIADSFYFLPVRYVIITSENILLPSVNFDCRLTFFIKRQQNAVRRKKSYNLLYCKFFLSKSLSGEYCHLLLLFNLAPASSNICLTFSMLIDSTTL